MIYVFLPLLCPFNLLYLPFSSSFNLANYQLAPPLDLNSDF